MLGVDFGGYLGSHLKMRKPVLAPQGPHRHASASQAANVSIGSPAYYWPSCPAVCRALWVTLSAPVLVAPSPQVCRPCSLTDWASVVAIQSMFKLSFIIITAPSQVGLEPCLDVAATCSCCCKLGVPSTLYPFRLLLFPLIQLQASQLCHLSPGMWILKPLVFKAHTIFPSSCRTEQVLS